MPWWGWLTLGAVLLAAEIAVQTEFWLAVVGAAALLVGIGVLVGIPQPVWLQWVLFATLSVVLAVTVRRYARDRVERRRIGLPPELVGEHGTSLGDIAPGAVGSVEVRGSTWRARNVGDRGLAKGEPVRVEALEGLTLDVRG